LFLNTGSENNDSCSEELTDLQGQEFECCNQELDLSSEFEGEKCINQEQQACHSDSQESSGGDQHDISDNPANSSDEEFTGNVVIKDKINISDESEDSEEYIELQGTDEQDTTTCEQQEMDEQDTTTHHEQQEMDEQDKITHHEQQEMDEQDTTTSEQQEHGNSMEDQANQNIDQESVDYLTLVQWICLILIKLKLRYNCSNSLFSLIVNLIYFILSLIKHPLHLFFPQTLNDLMLISNLRVYNECEIMAVCPNLKCNCLYKLSDIVRTHNGEKMSKVCKNKIFGKTCQAELAYPEHLLWEEKMGPLQEIPFFAPV